MEYNMNKIVVLKRLSVLLSQVNYHKDFPADLINLLSNSGQEAKFLTIFQERLKILLRYGPETVNILPSKFEHLKGTGENLYSMHVNTKDLNIRILYTFESDGTLLLLPFHERQGKSKTNYTNYIPEALKRKLFKGDDES